VGEGAAGWAGAGFGGADEPVIGFEWPRGADGRTGIAGWAGDAAAVAGGATPALPTAFVEADGAPAAAVLGDVVGETITLAPDATCAGVTAEEGLRIPMAVTPAPPITSPAMTAGSDQRRAGRVGACAATGVGALDEGAARGAPNGSA